MTDNNQALRAIAKSNEWPQLQPLMQATSQQHGDAPRWEQALAELASAMQQGKAPDAQALRQLHPWRKGPWQFGDLVIDTEWRSDWKWQRLLPHLPDLTNQRILDVGCGNGYFGWQMLAAGAAEVIGIDPTVLFVYQHLAASLFMQHQYPAGSNQVLPLRLEDLPEPNASQHFDTVFSMGVLYHRRDPLAHLLELRNQLRPNGTLVLETLICETGDIEPAGRYARMRNVHLVPEPLTITRWLQELGFTDCKVIDITATTTQEQRSTPWMTFESLSEALNPEDSSRTIEDLPAPVRGSFMAHWQP